MDNGNNKYSETCKFFSIFFGFKVKRFLGILKTLPSKRNTISNIYLWNIFYANSSLSDIYDSIYSNFLFVGYNIIN